MRESCFGLDRGRGVEIENEGCYDKEVKGQLNDWRKRGVDGGGDS